jgi:hypothetical protein
VLLTLVLSQAHGHAIVNVVWLPSEYGDSIACVCSDGTLSLWEEVAAGQLAFIPFIRFSVISSVLAVILYFHARFFLLLLLVFCTLRYYLVLSASIQVQLETS